MQVRWRQLRSCAGGLKSITWAYRARITPFEPDALHPNADDDQAEQVLSAVLVEWRQGLAGGASLNNTTLRKRFPEWVFKHNQREPKDDSCLQRWRKSFLLTCCCHRYQRKPKADRSHPHAPVLGSTKVDDYYSPINPEDYIELRLKPAIAFYQKRVPTNTHLRTAIKLSLLTATVASSFLARYKLTHMVTIVTAFSSMIIAYSEFADADRKAER